MMSDDGGRPPERSMLNCNTPTLKTLFVTGDMSQVDIESYTMGVASPATPLTSMQHINVQNTTGDGRYFASKHRLIYDGGCVPLAPPNFNVVMSQSLRYPQRGGRPKGIYFASPLTNVLLNIESRGG